MKRIKALISEKKPMTLRGFPMQSSKLIDGPFPPKGKFQWKRRQ